MKKIIISSLLLIPLIFILAQQSSPQTGPFIDIKVSTSTNQSSYVDGPISVTRGTRIYLKWQGQADFCYALGSWKGFRNPNGETSYTLYRPGKYVYALVCASLPKNLQPFEAQTFFLQDVVAFDYVEVNVSLPLPQVDLKINDSDGPLSLSGPATLNLRWRTIYDPSRFEISCEASGPNWQGRKNPTGYERINVDLPSGEYTYTFKCDFKCRGQICPALPTRSVSDSVKVIVQRVESFPTTTPQLDVKVFDPRTNSWVDGPISLSVGSTTKVKWEVRGRMYNRFMCVKYGDWQGNVGQQGEEEVTINEAKTYTFGVECSLSYRCDAPICPQVILPDVTVRDEVKVNGVPVKFPDLSVQGIKFYKYNLPETPENEIPINQLSNYLGQSVTVKAILKNIGDADTPGFFNVKWFLNGNQVGYGSHQPLKAGETSEDNVRYLWQVSNGFWVFRFVADSDNHLQEENELNNSYEIRIIIFPKYTPLSKIKITPYGSIEDYELELKNSQIKLYYFVQRGLLNSDCSNLVISETPSFPYYHLNYYLEGDCKDPNSTLWVKIPRLNNLQEKTIYLLAEASNTFSYPRSNPYKVFTFFDDFEQQLSNNWEFKTCTNGDYEVKNGLLILKPGTDNLARPYLKLKNQISLEKFPIVLEYKARGGSFPFSQVNAIFNWDGEIGNNWCSIKNGTGAIDWGEIGMRIETYSNFETKIISTSTATPNDMWKVYSLRIHYYYDPNAREYYYDVVYSSNRDPELRALVKSTGYKNIGFSGREQFWAENTYFDWVRIRKFLPVKIEIESEY